jgi:Cu+-exporting ATPase
VTVIDPVCGMQVNPETAAQHRDTSTGTVSFCFASCATAFDSEPQRYAAAAAVTAPGAGSQ